MIAGIVFFALGVALMAFPPLLRWFVDQTVYVWARLLGRTGDPDDMARYDTEARLTGRYLPPLIILVGGILIVLAVV